MTGMHLSTGKVLFFWRKLHITSILINSKEKDRGGKLRLELFVDLLKVLFRIITILPLMLLVTLFMGKRSIGELPVFDFLRYPNTRIGGWS